MLFFVPWYFFLKNQSERQRERERERILSGAITRQLLRRDLDCSVKISNTKAQTKIN